MTEAVPNEASGSSFDVPSLRQGNRSAGGGRVPSPAAMPGAQEVTPRSVRARISEVLAQPAATPQQQVDQFERAHEVLYEALGWSRKEGK